MQLYHGTTSKFRRELEEEGLSNPYLTDEWSLALYYAEVVAEELGGYPMIVTVNVQEQFLQYDSHAVDEPVGYGSKPSSELEEEVEAMWEEQSLLHPEWVKGDIISIPKSEWQLSMDTVASCYHNGIVPPEQLVEMIYKDTKFKTTPIYWYDGPVWTALEEFPDHVYLQSIQTKIWERNHGLGTKALLRAIQYATAKQKPLLVFASNELGGNLNRLEKWYERNGFYKEVNKLKTDFNYNYRHDGN